jgi:hypothetical protein
MAMLWFFERDDHVLKLETRYDDAAAEYVAIVHFPEGPAQCERFPDPESFRRWLVAFEENLGTDRWRSRGGPVLLPDGWPSKRLA